MDNFKILNNLEDPILVIDQKSQILFSNIAFKRQFGSISNIAKIKNKFNFVDICVLNPEELSTTTPINLLLTSSENFYAHTSFQKTKEEYLYFNISAVIKNSFKIIAFKDVTAESRYQKMLAELELTNKKITSLEKENKKFEQLKEKAQDQAIKMSLLNRVSTIMRNSKDINSIIKLTIEEVHQLVGAYKTYYAIKTGSFFKIQSITPNNHKNHIATNIYFEEETLTQIKNKEICLATCIKEHKDAPCTLSKNTKRIIIPIFHKAKLLGLIVTLTTQKGILKDNIDILESISTQLSSAIIQTSLFEQINKKNAKLQKTITELNETQLHLINSEKMASVGQLVAGVAHEINTPLASINSNNEISKKLINKTEILTEKQMHTLKSLNAIDNEAIKRINNIVKSLKKFVRLDEAELQETDINNEIDLTLQLITHEIKNKITLIKNYGKLPPINCYVNLLNQVFMNILINACQSIGEKGTSGVITITTSYEDEQLIVSIKDSGVGMSKKVQSQIFHTGFTTKKPGIGTGLGLAISNKIIQKHKGTINFSSVPLEGSEFIIRIPSQKNA